MICNTKKQTNLPEQKVKHDQGLFGVFDDADVVKVIHLIERINKNASVSVYGQRSAAAT